MSKSQATLREVGTTNRTRIADYERAINERTRLLLRVHRSNFAITGFTEQPGLADLVALAHRRSIPLMEDLGSGALFDLRSIGIANEAGVSTASAPASTSSPTAETSCWAARKPASSPAAPISSPACVRIRSFVRCASTNSPMPRSKRPCSPTSNTITMPCPCCA